MIKHSFNKNTNILEVIYTGNITSQEIIELNRAIKNNKQYPRVLKIIADTKEAHFNFPIKDLDIIVEETIIALEFYTKMIDAIIIDNPKNTVLTVLYKNLFKTKNYEFEIFATKEAALNWLNKW